MYIYISKFDTIDYRTTPPLPSLEYSGCRDYLYIYYPLSVYNDERSLFTTSCILISDQPSPHVMISGHLKRSVYSCSEGYGA